LTPDAPNQFSSIFYQKPINTVHFKARFDVYLGSKDSGADGIVFAFVREPGLGIEGYGGQMAFLTGLDGYGIEFDTFPTRGGTPGNQPDTENHVGVSKAEPGTTVGKGFALYQNDDLPHDLERGYWLSAEVHFTSGHVQMWMSRSSLPWARELVIEYTIPDWQDYEAYLGFTAATGGSYNAHRVDNVAFSGVDPGIRQNRHVDASAPESGDGQSWETPFKTIQRAMNIAFDGDIVTVAPGTYLENIDFGGKNIVLQSKDPLDPDTVDNTIIDGSQLGPVVAFTGTEVGTCVLSGFTIRNGSAYTGGGISGGWRWDTHTRATILNNTITDNLAEEGGGVSYCDGIIKSNRITNNEAKKQGGGLYGCDGMIMGNTITDNRCTGPMGGGGALNFCGGLIANNQISRNVSGGYAGGLYLCGGTIQSNLITHNSAGMMGGGLYGGDGIIINNTIVENEAGAGYDGGGLYQYSGTIMNCIIWDNVPEQLVDCSMPTYSLIQGWSEGGEGNKSYVSDLFVYGEGNYHLHPDSRCIDSGRRPYPIASGLDMDGHLRIVEKYITSNPLVDMGAYEYNSKPFEITEFNLRPNGTRRIVWSAQPDDTYTIWWRKHSDQKGWWELETITTDWDESAVYFVDETWVSPDWKALLYRVEMNWPVEQTP